MSDPLQPILTRQRRDVALLFETLGDAIANALVRAGATNQPMTPGTYRTVMQEVDAGLDVIFGRFPGDPNAAVRQVVVRDSRLARLQPLDAAVRRWQGAMTLALRSRVEEEARRG